MVKASETAFVSDPQQRSLAASVCGRMTPAERADSLQMGVEAGKESTEEKRRRVE